MNKEYYPSEVAETLAQLAGLSHLTDQKKLTDFFYHFMACAENEYNSDYFRVAWNTLQTVCDKVERGLIHADNENS